MTHLLREFSGVFHRFCKSARSATRQREKWPEKMTKCLHSDGSTIILIILEWRIIPFATSGKHVREMYTPSYPTFI